MLAGMSDEHKVSFVQLVAHFTRDAARNSKTNNIGKRGRPQPSAKNADL